MAIMTAIERIWDTGATTPNDISQLGELSKFYSEFKGRTGSTYVATVRWQYLGQAYECEYPAEVLPDFTGIVIYGLKVKLSEPQHYPLQRFLKVLNPDATFRCRIDAPVIDEKSVPGKRWIQLPRRFNELKLPWGVPAFDGWRMVAMDVDWLSGQMKRWVLAPNLDR